MPRKTTLKDMNPVRSCSSVLITTRTHTHTQTHTKANGKKRPKDNFYENAWKFNTVIIRFPSLWGRNLLFQKGDEDGVCRRGINFIWRLTKCTVLGRGVDLRGTSPLCVFQQNKLKDSYRSLKKKRQQITAVRKMSRYQEHGKTKVIWMLNTKEKNDGKTNWL